MRLRRQRQQEHTVRLDMRDVGLLLSIAKNTDPERVSVTGEKAEQGKRARALIALAQTITPETWIEVH